MELKDKNLNMWLSVLKSFL